MRVIHLSILAGLLWLPIAGLGQSEEWMPQYHIDILKSMKLTYKKPDGFTEVPGTECFKFIPKLKLILTCAGNQLHSEDGQFIAFIPIYRILTKQDSIDIKRMFPNGIFEGVDRRHASQIRGNIRYSLGDTAAQNWKSYVTYYSSTDARYKFNADTAISFSIKLNPGEYYLGKYNHLDALFLQREGKGFINFYCFYTDKAKKHLAKYWNAIEGIFRYED